MNRSVTIFPRGTEGPYSLLSISAAINGVSAGQTLPAGTMAKRVQ